MSGAAPDIEDIIRVYDTSAIIHDPFFLTKETSPYIVVPTTVIEELGRLAGERQTPRGESARYALKQIEAIQDSGKKESKIGDNKKCFLFEGRELHILGAKELLIEYGDRDVADNHILAAAARVKREICPSATVDLVTKDRALRVKARGLEEVEIESTFYSLDLIVRENTKPADRENKGTYQASEDEATKILSHYLAKKGEEGTDKPYRVPRSEFPLKDLHLNEFILASAIMNPQEDGPAAKRRRKKTNVVFRYLPKTNEVVEYKIPNRNIKGFGARGFQQQVALEMLLDPEIHCVTLVGEAGCGKTILALLAGVEQIAEGTIEDAIKTERDLKRQLSRHKTKIGKLEKQLSEENYQEHVVRDTPRRGKAWKQRIFDTQIKARFGFEYRSFEPMIDQFFKEPTKIPDHKEYQSSIHTEGAPAYKTFKKVWGALKQYSQEQYKHKIREEEMKKEKAEEQIRSRKGAYERIGVTRINVSSGDKFGFLPGDVKDKMKAWLPGIAHNVEAIAKKQGDSRAFQNQVDEHLEYHATELLRGASLQNRYFIIEEAQNLTLAQVELILNRAGPGTKIIFTGDLAQIDNKYLNSRTSGLAYLIDCGCIPSEELTYGHRMGIVFLDKSQRSDLSKLAGELRRYRERALERETT
jgi:predicted ribonuclease YlaK